MSEKRKRATPDELDAVLDAVLPAIPPERRDEMRALLRAARNRRPPKHAVARRLAPTPDDDAGDDQRSAPSQESPHAPVPPITPERATPDELARMLALVRAAGAPPTAPRSRLDGPGTLRVAAEGEGMKSGAGSAGSQAGGESPQKVRLAVRAGREPLGPTVRLSDVAPEPLRWLWPGRIPAGKLTLLDGDPGLGKSTLLCELAARLSRGDPLPGDASPPGAPRGVLLFSAEDDVFDTIRPRIDAAGGDPKRIVAFIAVPDGSDTGRPFTLPHDLPILDALVEKVDAVLVVFDQLVDYLPTGVSPQSLPRVRHTMAALRASAERSGAAVVGVRHLTKSPSANPLYRGLGSIGLMGSARAGLLLAADPDDAEHRILAVGKRNLTRPAASLAFRLEAVPGASVARLVWEGESPWTATQLLHAQRDAEHEGAARRSVVAEARAAGPRPAQELREEAAARGIGRSSLHAARKAEDISIAKEPKAQGRWIWTLNSPIEEREAEDVAISGSSEVQHL